MRCWIFAVVLGAIGTVLGLVCASGAGVTSLQPVWALSGGAWGAILGAILGGTGDIVQAVNELARQRRQAEEESERRRSGGGGG